MHLTLVGTLKALEEGRSEFIQNLSVSACDNEIIYVSRNQNDMTLLMILLLLFLQKQSLAFAVYLFGIGTLLTGPGLKKKTHVIML